MTPKPNNVSAVYYAHHRSSALKSEQGQVVEPELPAPLSAMPKELPPNVESITVETKVMIIGDDVPASGASTGKTATDDGLTREQRIRAAQVKLYGDTSEVHHYADLLMKVLNQELFSDEELIDF